MITLITSTIKFFAAAALLVGMFGTAIWGIRHTAREQNAFERSGAEPRPGYIR